MTVIDRMIDSSWGLWSVVDGGWSVVGGLWFVVIGVVGYLLPYLSSRGLRQKAWVARAE